MLGISEIHSANAVEIVDINHLEGNVGSLSSKRDLIKQSNGEFPCRVFHDRESQQIWINASHDGEIQLEGQFYYGGKFSIQNSDGQSVTKYINRDQLDLRADACGGGFKGLDRPFFVKNTLTVTNDSMTTQIRFWCGPLTRRPGPHVETATCQF